MMNKPLKEIDGLVKKYNVPTPRYTIYPAVPYWDSSNISFNKWIKALKRTFDETNNTKGISLYLHMPFCESLCTFCGYDKRITTNHFVEEIYIDALLKEFDNYLEQLSSRPNVAQIYMGGGTPTFFEPQALEMLFDKILDKVDLKQDAFLHFEGHPNNTTREHLEVLAKAGFNSVGFGIQDFDEKVQQTINRVQTFEKVHEVYQNARESGFEYIKFDLLYGLPFQSVNTVNDTLNKVAKLRPDLVAIYSYEHIPDIKPSQRAFKDKNLPENSKKYQLFETGAERLLSLGYEEIGVEHFALPNHPFAKAVRENKLDRNFIGYTHVKTDMMLGLGAIAFSNAHTVYVQNTGVVEEYHDKVFNNQPVIEKMHVLTKEDMLLRSFINSVLCTGEADWSQELFDSLSSEAKYEVIEIQKAGFIDVSNQGFKVTPKGKPFIRTICRIFDSRQHRFYNPDKDKYFSKSI